MNPPADARTVKGSLVASLIRRGGVSLLVLGLWACSSTRKEAATAIVRADRMVTALRDRAVKVMPDETKEMADSLQAAHGHAAAGNHEAALIAARYVAAEAIRIANSLASKSTELSSTFTAISAELPRSVERIRNRLNQLSGALPSRIDPAKFAALKSDFAGWADTWNAAIRDYQQGELGAAMVKAKEIKHKVADANTLLGIESTK